MGSVEWGGCGGLGCGRRGGRGRVCGVVGEGGRAEAVRKW